MTPTPQAAANWTIGLAQNLIPANWTVTDGNNTGIKCDPSAGNVGAFYQCAERLGHKRAVCFTSEKINGTFVCSCSAFAGWDFSSNSANATYGTVAGCASRNPTNYNLNAVLCVSNMLVVTFTLLYALATIWKGRAMCIWSVTNTTLAWVTLASLSLFMWFGSVMLANIVLMSDELMVRTAA